MEEINVTLPLSGKVIPVCIERKKMKTCRLKVYPDRHVVLSLPKNISKKWMEVFLDERAGWIETKLEFFEKAGSKPKMIEVRNGRSIKMFGKDMIFVVTECDANYVYTEGKTIYICMRQPENQEKRMKLFENWWRGQALSILRERVKIWYPIVQKYGVKEPLVTVRKMKTLWGSCSVNRNKITFNLYLIQAEMACVDYVVLHELAHFIHPNHSRQFYDFLSNYMPDWKVRKEALNRLYIMT